MKREYKHNKLWLTATRNEDWYMYSVTYDNKSYARIFNVPHKLIESDDNWVLQEEKGHMYYYEKILEMVEHWPTKIFIRNYLQNLMSELWKVHREHMPKMTNKEILKFSDLWKNLNWQCKCSVCWWISWSCTAYKRDDWKVYCWRCMEKELLKSKRLLDE